MHREKWGPFGRAWSLEQSSLELIEPRYSQLTAVPPAWSASSSGPVTGELVLTPLRWSFREGPKKSKEALQAYRAKCAGKLNGKIVLLSDPKVPTSQNNPQFRRQITTAPRWPSAAMSNWGVVPDVGPGLCATCAHVETIRSDRGSAFFRCGLSDIDPRFPKYPTLPVVQCSGWDSVRNSERGPREPQIEDE